MVVGSNFILLNHLYCNQLSQMIKRVPGFSLPARLRPCTAMPTRTTALLPANMKNSVFGTQFTMATMPADTKQTSISSPQRDYTLIMKPFCTSVPKNSKQSIPKTPRKQPSKSNKRKAPQPKVQHTTTQTIQPSRGRPPGTKDNQQKTYATQSQIGWRLTKSQQIGPRVRPSAQAILNRKNYESPKKQQAQQLPDAPQLLANSFGICKKPIHLNKGLISPRIPHEVCTIKMLNKLDPRRSRYEHFGLNSRPVQLPIHLRQPECTPWDIEDMYFTEANDY